MVEILSDEKWEETNRELKKLVDKNAVDTTKLRMKALREGIETIRKKRAELLKHQRFLRRELNDLKERKK